VPKPTSDQPSSRDSATRDASDPSGASLQSLLRRLADDGRALLRQEVQLAKIELWESARVVAGASSVAAGGVLLIVLGLLLLLVFVVLGLGALLGDRYWLSTLLVGLTLCLGGAITLAKGRSRLRIARLAPTDSFESLQDSARWAAQTARRLKPES